MGGGCSKRDCFQSIIQNVQNQGKISWKQEVSCHLGALVLSQGVCPLSLELGGLYQSSQALKVTFLGIV